MCIMRVSQAALEKAVDTLRGEKAWAIRPSEELPLKEEAQAEAQAEAQLGTSACVRYFISLQSINAQLIQPCVRYAFVNFWALRR